ncbi:MAG: hypothetical protein M3P98_03095 [bacterium]|nr:hypothetical protein [bacterium]
MKSFSMIVKYVIVPCSTVIGLFYGFDAYIVNRANTAVEPTKAAVTVIQEDVREIKQRTINIENILMSRNK